VTRPIRVNSLDEVSRIAEVDINPGMVVVPGTSAGKCKPAGATDTAPLGFALDDMAKTTLTAGSPVSVGVRGRYTGILSASQIVAEGDDLELAANGELAKYSTGTKFGRALEAVTTGAGETKDIEVQI